MEKPKIPTTEKSILASSISGGVEVPETVTENKNKNVDRNVDYIRFGSDNLYVQALAGLYRKSIGLRGIINSKVIYVSAGGFSLEEESGTATDFINAPNASEDTLTDLFEKYLVDRFMSGNVYLEVIKVDDSKIHIDHIQTTKVRRHKDREHVLVHSNWANFNSTKKDAIKIPLYPQFAKVNGFMRSVIHVKDYEPDFDWYGIPTYIASMDAAAIGYKTNKWNVSRLDNAFQSSGVLVIDGNMSDEEAKELNDDFNDNMVGEGNQGKVMLIIKKLGGEGTTFTPINNGTDGDWNQLHTQSTDDLIIANNWKKSLAGITESSGFDTDRIINDYQIVKGTFLVKEQNKFIKIISKIMLAEGGLDLEGLTIINKPPISLITELTADKFTFKWEARREAGLEFDSEDEKQMSYIDESTSTSESNTEKAVSAITKSLDWIKKKL